jgi:hypothetical protein
MSSWLPAAAPPCRPAAAQVRPPVQIRIPGGDTKAAVRGFPLSRSARTVVRTNHPYNDDVPSEATERHLEQPPDRAPERQQPTDRGLHIMLKWVFGALIVTVLFSVLVVELTLRWFR